MLMFLLSLLLYVKLWIVLPLWAFRNIQMKQSEKPKSIFSGPAHSVLTYAMCDEVTKIYTFILKGHTTKGLGTAA